MWSWRIIGKINRWWKKSEKWLSWRDMDWKGAWGTHVSWWNALYPEPGEGYTDMCAHLCVCLHVRGMCVHLRRLVYFTFSASSFLKYSFLVAFQADSNIFINSSLFTALNWFFPSLLPDFPASEFPGGFRLALYSFLAAKTEKSLVCG